MHEFSLPDEQHAYDDLPSLSPAVLHVRRERVFLFFAGLFLGSLAMLNVLGVARFIDLSFTVFGFTIPMPLAVGVLPYPITFLCTDFISELYGRRRANQVVWMGLFLNGWVMLILWLGGALPGFPGDDAFMHVRGLAFGAVTASMMAYLAAQFIDVQVFHFWKRVTDGRHMWLRNNGSTLVSQLVDTIAVILITYELGGLPPLDPNRSVASQLAVFIASGYVFKVVAAFLDTVPFIFGAKSLARYMRLPPPDSNFPHPPAGAAVEASVG